MIIPLVLLYISIGPEFSDNPITTAFCIDVVFSPDYPASDISIPATILSATVKLMNLTSPSNSPIAPSL